jgi:hypothetical protein
MGKILFFDLDGTLWARGELIPDSAAQALVTARSRGHRVVINSGRSRGFIHNRRLFDLGLDAVISGCGTMIEVPASGQERCSRDARENRLLNFSPMSRELTRACCEMTRKHCFKTIFEGPRYLYCNPEEFRNQEYIRRVQASMREGMLRIPEDGGDMEIVKLSCDLEDAVGREAGLAWFDRNFTSLFHNERVCEFVPRGFSKGSGMREVARFFGADREDLIAFGDGVNDLEMFREAGIAVAMGGASLPAIEAADRVTSTLQEAGIARALSELGLI